MLGCCPGGTGSNFWTLLLKGDINMSITMTFMSTMLALAFMPLWIFTIGGFTIKVPTKFLSDQDFQFCIGMASHFNKQKLKISFLTKPPIGLIIEAPVCVLNKEKVVVLT